ncbi:MAG: MFS transporter [Gemmatimonadota bacterium]
MQRPSGRAATVAVFFAVLFDVVGFGIVLPLLPSYAARFQPNAAAIGLLVASDSLMVLLAAPLWGRLSDRIGRRPVLLVSLLGNAVSYLLFAFAGSFGTILLSRVIAGASGATVNIAQAYLADITPPERRSQAMGILGAAFGLGFIIGPALGGLTSRAGEMVPGLVAAGVALANSVFAALVLRETRTGRRSEAPAPRTPSWTGLVRPFGVMFLSTLAFTVMYVVFPLYCERTLGLDRSHVSYLYVFIGTVGAVVQAGLIGRLARAFGDERLMLAGSLLLALGFGLVPASAGSGLAGLLGCLFLVSVGFGLTGPSLASHVSRATHANEQGRALGALQSVGAVARIVGPPAAGQVYHLGGAAAFLAAAAVAALAAGLSALVSAPRSLGTREETVPAD